MEITVFTPTYNRAYLLPQLYESLKRQTSFDFEWLVIDDGSTDDTEALVESWCAGNDPFPIRFYKKENGGKHQAINMALPLARGKLFFIVDSDDYLTDTSIETIIRICRTLPKDSTKKFAGVAGCKGKNAHQIFGTTFSGEILDCSTLDRDRNGISGDKAEVFYTEVLRQYPFPEFDGEKFVTEAAVWDRMALDGYVLRYFNEVIYVCAYLEDGLTHQGLDLYYKNPMGYGYYLRQSRKAGKFPKAVQRYYDVECYLHWRKEMNVNEVADLIGTDAVKLISDVILYQLRQYGSRCKKALLKRGKR